MSETQVFVRYAFRIKPKDQVDSYDDALDSSQEVIKTITNRSSPLHDDLQIRWTGLDNELSDSGEWCTLTITFSVLHYLNLS